MKITQFNRENKFNKAQNTSFKSAYAFDVAEKAFPKNVSEKVILDTFNHALHKVTGETNNKILRGAATLLGISSLNSKTTTIYKYPGYKYIEKIKSKWGEVSQIWIESHISRFCEDLPDEDANTIEVEKQTEELKQAIDFLYQNNSLYVNFEEPPRGFQRFIVLSQSEKKQYDSEHSIIKRLLARKNIRDEAHYNVDCRKPKANIKTLGDYSNEIQLQKNYGMARLDQDLLCESSLQSARRGFVQIKDLSELETKFQKGVDF